MYSRGAVVRLVISARQSVVRVSSCAPSLRRSSQHYHSRSFTRDHFAKCPTLFKIAAPVALVVTMASTVSNDPSPTTSAKVAILTTAGCPHCKKAKAALTQAGIPYQEYELSEQLDLLAKIKQQTGRATVPQIFISQKLIGGADDTEAALADGSFAQLVAKATGPALPESIDMALKAAAAINKSTTSSQGAAPSSSPELQQAVVELQSARVASLGSAVSCLAKKKTEDEAIALLAKLQSSQLITLLDSDNNAVIDKALVGQRPALKLACVDDLPLPSKLHEPLNTHFTWFGPARPAPEVASDLRKLILELFSIHMTPDGRLIDYKAMVKDPKFRRYVNASAELQKVDVSNLSRDEALSFWINIYNALIIHATAAVGPATSTLGRLSWFDNVSYQISGSRFTSNHIEHGVLRNNSPSPASLFSLLGKPQWAGTTFKSSDPRSLLAISPVDPRIHFALNCGAVSCPPIKVYIPEKLEVGLSAAANAFCSSEVSIDEAANKVVLSMIFKWYGKDFGSKEQLLRFIAANTSPENKQKLEKMLANGADGIQMEYKPYDWSTNAK